MSEHSSNPESLNQSYLSTALKDFYFSFRFSQGDQKLQPQLLKGVISTYSPSMISAIHDHEMELFAKFESLRLPGEHVAANMDDNYIRREFLARGSRFLDAVSEVHDHPASRTLTPNIMSWIVYGIIDRDIAFVHPDTEQSRIYRTSDQYESYFREYIMRTAPTGSKAYDKLFLGLHRAVMSSGVDEKVLGMLANQWERLHPGEVFLSDDT